MAQWNMLHKELWGLIFDHLPVASLAQSALVCSEWRYCFAQVKIINLLSRAMAMDETLWANRAQREVRSYLDDVSCNFIK